MSKDARDRTREIEQRILFGMQLKPEFAAEARALLTHEDFRDKDTAEEFRRICDAIDKRGGSGFALREHCQLSHGVSGEGKLPALYLQQVKVLRRARWQAAQLKKAGRWANASDVEECEELWEKFIKETQAPT